jgi:uncharacterized protein YcfJ
MGSSVISLGLGLGGGKSATSSGRLAGGAVGFNISTRDTESNIASTTPTNLSGEVTIAYGTDTEDLYIWDGSSWYVYKNI